jgi:predicted nucleic acid-binding protein
MRDDHVAHRIVLAAPSLLVWEVGNALRYSQELGSADVRSALRDLIDLQIVLYEPDADWLEDAVEWAYQRNWTLYDASYVALARHLRAALYTADATMLRDARKEVAIPISEYPRRRRA